MYLTGSDYIRAQSVVVFIVTMHLCNYFLQCFANSQSLLNNGEFLISA